MTKDEYLNKLKAALKNGGVKDYDAVIGKYESRFKLAKEAGFSEEEAASKFGEPEKVVKGLKPNIEPPVQETEQKEEAKSEPHVSDSGKYTIVISSVADDINLDYGDVASPYVDFNDANPDDYLIEKKDDTKFFKLEFRPKAKFFSKMHRSHILVILPRGILISSLRISVVSSKVTLGDIVADEIKLSTTSGSVDSGDVRSELTSFTMVSGNVHLRSIATTTLRLTTVSGSLTVDDGEIANLNVNGVSGNVTIAKGHVTKVTSSILSGKVVVEGESRKQ